MTPVSVQQLRSLLHSVARVKPRITAAAKSLLGDDEQLLLEFGIPVRIGDWFVAAEEITPYSVSFPLPYAIDHNERTLKGGAVIGTASFGCHVRDSQTGNVVYIDSSSRTQLVNRSIAAFLYFVGRFKASGDNHYRNIDDVIADCRAIDPSPLSDPEAIWSVTFEEAKAGLY